jgi:hypothetical protein
LAVSEATLDAQGAIAQLFHATVPSGVLITIDSVAPFEKLQNEFNDPEEVDVAYWSVEKALWESFTGQQIAVGRWDGPSEEDPAD